MYAIRPSFKKFIDKAVSEGRTANDIGKSISEAGWGLSHIQEAERYYGSKKKVRSPLRKWKVGHLHLVGQ